MDRKGQGFDERELRSSKLQTWPQTDKLKPGQHLKRARDQLEMIDIESDGLLSPPENKEHVHVINRIIWEIKKRFDRQTIK